MAFFSKKRLAKSLVTITFLCIGGMLINLVFELSSESTMLPVIHKQDCTVIMRSTQNLQPLHSQNPPPAQVKPTAHAQPTQLPPCNKTGENLVGRIPVNQTVPSTEDGEKFWTEKNWVLKGGAWRPTSCQAVSKVAIVVPYHNRYPHLKVFLRHMHPILKRQLLDYRIIVVEQNGNTSFNRGILSNIGYKESLKLRHDFQCFIFHDVDLIPEDDRNYYGCPLKPRHLSVAINTFSYQLPYRGIFGGVASFIKEHFDKINGYSNTFWGWGGEDDDLYNRIRAVGFVLSRPTMVFGRYTMLKFSHNSAKLNPDRLEKLKISVKKMMVDGLNSLKYEIVKVEEHQLYTKITVNVDPKAV